MEVLLDIFESYGWPGMIGIVVCMVIFILLKKYNNKLSLEVTSGLEKVGEKLTDQMAKQNDQLVNVIIAQQDKLFDHIIDSKNKDIEKHTDMMIDKINLSDEIVQSLKTIMYSHNSQRAFILEFHNSYQNLSGIPFAKYSCTYEWFDRGIKSISNNCIGLPFSQISTIVSKILKSENQQLVCKDISVIEEINPSIYELLLEAEIKQVIFTAMFDSNNIPIGLLILEYMKPHKITEEELNQLKIQTAELTSVINIRYKYTAGDKNIVSAQ